VECSPAADATCGATVERVSERDANEVVAASESRQPTPNCARRGESRSVQAGVCDAVMVAVREAQERAASVLAASLRPTVEVRLVR